MLKSQNKYTPSLFLTVKKWLNLCSTVAVILITLPTAAVVEALASKSNDEAGSSISRLSDQYICRGAYNPNSTGWDHSVVFASHVEEAERRGLSVDDCRAAIGLAVANKSNNDVGSSMSRLSDQYICRGAYNANSNSWDHSVAFASHMEEAKRRGLSVDDCRVAIGLAVANNSNDDGGSSISRLSDQYICRGAYNANSNGWDHSVAFASHMEEAKRRGLSLDDCRHALGIHATPENIFAALENDALCMRALDRNRREWEARSSFAGEIAEAKRRGLSVDDCRVAIGTSVASNSNGDGDSSVSRLADQYICRGAYNANITGWEHSVVFASHVEEAKRRGLSVDDCRAAIGLFVASNKKIEKDASTVCLSALNGQRLDWETSKTFAVSVAEAKRRGLSVDDCRAAIGLAQLDQGNASTVILQPEAVAKILSLAEICQQSLNAERMDWSSAASAADARKQADALGITVDLCRMKLGLNKDQSRIAEEQAIVTQSPDTSGTISNASILQKKVALVIGNSNYQHSPVLANPHNDAEAVASALNELGFEVIKGLDLSNSETVAKIREFAKSTKTADLSLFFYAGHGLQVAGENYVVPVDATVEDETAINFELINVSTITNFMGGLDKVGVVLLDACRDNPFSRSLKRSLSASRAASVEQGLAPISAEGGGLFVAFSTAPGDVAADGEGMTNSPFTTALLKHLPTKGLEINTVMTRVKAEVAKMTKNDQRPWTNSDLTTEVYLAPVQ